jgi:hypothetical protein
MSAKPLMPSWFVPVLAVTTIIVVFSGLRVAKDSGVLPKDKPQ